MNQVNTGTDSIVDQFAEMPISPRERQAWFMDKYEDLVLSHIANLRTFFGNFPKEKQSIVFNSITDDGRIQIMYGKFLITLPSEKIANAKEWMEKYNVFIDNMEVGLVSKVEPVHISVRGKVNNRLSPIDKLLPPILPKDSKARNSQNILILRKIDVRKR